MRDDTLERYEQAVAWREATLPLLRAALAQLTAARDQCPSSLEAVGVQRAIKETRTTLRECERSLVVARRMVAREQRRLLDP